MPTFSQKSKDLLQDAHPHIELVLNEAIKYIDFSIVTIHRGEEKQNELFEKGFSKVRYPKSKHNTKPSVAADVAPYYKEYGALFGGPEQIKRIMLQTGKNKDQVETFIIKAYARLIGILEGVALSNNIRLRVGLDWDGDFDTLDQTFHDLGHIELLDYD